MLTVAAIVVAFILGNFVQAYFAAQTHALVTKMLADAHEQIAKLRAEIAALAEKL